MKKAFLLVFVVGVSFVSCKKEGCTDSTATNYDSKAKKDNGTCVYPAPDPQASVLCGGIAGNDKYLPLAVGYKWTYDRKMGNMVNLYSEEVVGTEMINGVSYYKVDFVNDQLASQGTIHYRVDANTGNIYRRDTNGNETLYMLGNPSVGQSIGSGTVSSLNASVTTQACSYTGCLEITESTIFGAKKTYFKKGIGYIKHTNGTSGGDELVGVSF